MEDIHLIFFTIIFFNLIFINSFIIFLNNKYNKNMKTLHYENIILEKKIYNISSILYNKKYNKNNDYVKTKYNSGTNFDLKRIYNNNIDNYITNSF